MIRPTLRLTILAFLLVACLAAPAWAEELQGTVKSVFPAEHQLIVLQSHGEIMTLHLDQHGKVFINNREGLLADLRPNDAVVIVGEKRTGRMLATMVVCQRK